MATVDQITVYRHVIAAGFRRPIGAESNNLGAVYATAIAFTNPGANLSALHDQWEPAHDPSKMTGWVSTFAPGSIDPTWQAANETVIQAEVVYLGKDITAGLALAAGQGMVAIPKVTDAFAKASVEAAQSLLPSWFKPEFMLRVVYIMVGGALVVGGLYISVKGAPASVVGKVLS